MQAKFEDLNVVVGEKKSSVETSTGMAAGVGQAHAGQVWPGAGRLMPHASAEDGAEAVISHRPEAGV